jgi:hypothetical protein
MEQLKELARCYLEREIMGEEFFGGIIEIMGGPDWTPACEKWLAEQILIVR